MPEKPYMPSDTAIRESMAFSFKCVAASVAGVLGFTLVARRYIGEEPEPPIKLGAML